MTPSRGMSWFGLRRHQFTEIGAVRLMCWCTIMRYADSDRLCQIQPDKKSAPIREICVSISLSPLWLKIPKIPQKTFRKTQNSKILNPTNAPHPTNQGTKKTDRVQNSDFCTQNRQTAVFTTKHVPPTATIHCHTSAEASSTHRLLLIWLKKTSKTNPNHSRKTPQPST